MHSRTFQLVSLISLCVGGTNTEVYSGPGTGAFLYVDVIPSIQLRATYVNVDEYRGNHGFFAKNIRRSLPLSCSEP